MNVIAIVVFGAIGGMARFALSGNVYGVLFINLIGALSLGYFITRADLKQHATWLRDGIATGFIGSFTTFSAFATDAIQIGERSIPLAGLYILASIAGGLSLGALGMYWAKMRHHGVLLRQPDDNQENA